MFTRCPQCNTVFRISATQLRVANGDVRCGNCAHVFNALGHLSDALPDDELQEEAVAGKPAAPGEQEQDGSPGDSDLEFDAPERTWSQYFIDATRRPAATTSADASDVPLDGELETITADPDEWRAFLDEMDESPAARWDDDMAPDALGREQQVYVVDQAQAGNHAQARVAQDSDLRAATESPAESPTTEPRGDIPMEAVSPAEVELGGTDYVHEPSEGPPIDAEAADEILADDAAELDWREEPATDRTRHGLWLAASFAMLALLLVQFVHMNRDRLAADEGFGPRLRELYAGLGAPLYPEWQLGSYRVRRAEAMAGASAPDSLDISAAVETTGSGTLGLPLVRVALRDQWANVVASRVFEPEQYLPEPLPEVVPAGTRIPVRLSVVDPGNEARGFVVDLCLPRRDGLDCQLNRDPFSP